MYLFIVFFINFLLKNEEVIEQLTLPNTYINFNDKTWKSNVKYFSGDWSSLNVSKFIILYFIVIIIYFIIYFLIILF